MQTDDLTRLDKIKKNIATSYQYFKENYDRYHAMRRFVFFSSMTEDDKIKLMSLGKPIITANILESFLSRMRGNFLDNEPAVSIKRNECDSRGTLIQDNQIEFLECYCREIITNPDNEDFGYLTYSQTMSGGMAVGEVFTKYPNERAWQQEIAVENCPDPTLCGFDPLAKESHKGDGEYCYKIIPMTYQKFVDKYGEDTARDCAFSSAGDATFGDFRWSSQVNGIDIILVAEYYWKKRHRERLFRLSDGRSVIKKELDKIMLEYELLDSIEQPPVVIQERMQEFVTIMRDEICQARILSSKETDFSMFPLVFCDGNSELLKNSNNATISQVTRPWIYHAIGPQKLKDFSMQTAAAEIENMIMSKLTVPVEGLPQDEGLLKAYTNYQQSSVITYNNYDIDNPEKLLNPPQPIQRTPTPAVVMECFQGSDILIQQILGSYDLQPAIQSDISGETIKQGALQASEAAKPYMKNYHKFLTRIVEIIIDLIPKYYDTPCTMPVKGLDGKRGYQIINDPNNPQSVSTQYDASALKVTIDVGSSINAQRQLALQQLTTASKVLPSFAQFLDQEGGEIIIDNMDLKGGDRLKVMYTQWMEQNKQKQAQMAQMSQQAEMAMRDAEIQKEQSIALQNQANAQATLKKANDSESQFVANMILEEQKVNDTKAIEVAKLEIEALKVKTDAQEKHITALLRAMEVHAENRRTEVETALAIDQHHHDKVMDINNIGHQMISQETENEQKEA